MGTNVGEIFYEIDADTSKLIGQRRTVERETDKMGFAFSGMAKAITAAISAIAIEGLVSKVIGAQRSFDVMFASLKTVTGGADQAGAAFERLRKFASTTPYTLDQAVGGFIKLKALGLDPSERAMTSFGNTSAAMGKSLTQMIEAVADASTGEFERLKEFGIKAKQEGDRVSLTFQGVTTKIGNNAAEITEYLTKIGEVQFAGAMSERMKTLDGDISNLQDSLEALYLSIAQSGIGDAVAAGVRKAAEAINELTTSVTEGGLTEYFDRLKPIILAAEVAAVSLAGAMAGRLVAAFIATITQAYASAAAMGVATVAARGFTAVLTLMGGPIGIAITGLALLALNWDKISGSAKSAADVSEGAAERIEAALARGGKAAKRQLTEQMGEAKATLAEIDQAIASLGAPSSPEDAGTSAILPDLDRLNADRDKVLATIRQIDEAITNAYGSGRRPANEGGGGLRSRNAPPPPPPAPKKDKFDDAGYLAGLARQTADGLDRVNMVEAEALRTNAAMLAQGKITRETAAKAVTLIEANAAFERRDIMLAAAEETRARIEQQGQEEVRLAERFAVEKQRAAAYAQDITAGGDLVAQEVLRFERVQAVLDAAHAKELLSEQEHAAAIVANRQQMVATLAEIEQRRVDAQVQAQMTLLSAAGGFFGASAEMLKRHEGEQSSTYKAMFALQKAFSISSAVVAIYTGAAKAWQKGWPLGAVEAAGVLAQGGALLNTIRGTQYGGGRQYGGPVDGASMYRVNEGGRPEMFQAANGSQFLMPNQRGEVIPSGQAGGAQVIELRVINQVPHASVSQRTGTDGRPELVIAEVAGQIAERRGPVWGALKTTNVRGLL